MCFHARLLLTDGELVDSALRGHCLCCGRRDPATAARRRLACISHVDAAPIRLAQQLPPMLVNRCVEFQSVVSRQGCRPPNQLVRRPPALAAAAGKDQRFAGILPADSPALSTVIFAQARGRLPPRNGTSSDCCRPPGRASARTRGLPRSVSRARRTLCSLKRTRTPASCRSPEQRGKPVLFRRPRRPGSEAEFSPSAGP